MNGTSILRFVAFLIAAIFISSIAVYVDNQFLSPVFDVLPSELHMIM